MKDEGIKVMVTGWERRDDGHITVEFLTTREEHADVLVLLDSMYHPGSKSELILSKPTGTTPTSQSHL